MLYKTKNLNWWLFCYIAIVLLIPLNIVFADEPAKKSNLDDEKDIRIFVGYTWYEMKEFNDKLRSEDNEEIKGGINLGVELSPISLKKGEPIFGEYKVPFTIKIPIFGIEYLKASSETTHSSSEGSATMKWELPVVGAYLSLADIQLFPNENSNFYLYLRPLSIGIYNLGDIMDAKLTISDRSGSYDASDTTVGFSTMLNLRYLFGKPNDNSIVFLAIGAGYRWLKFSDVELDPKGGFTIIAGSESAQKTTMSESLDYSGGMVRADFVIEF